MEDDCLPYINNNSSQQNVVDIEKNFTSYLIDPVHKLDEFFCLHFVLNFAVFLSKFVSVTKNAHNTVYK